MELLEISLTCQGCSAECRVKISTGIDAGGFRCSACGRHLLRFRVLKGFVYILSNPKMPGLVKVGCTTRRVEERVEELNSATGVPTPFIVEAYFASSAPEQHESEVHTQLDAKRIKGREFFEAGLTEAVQTVQAVVGSDPVFLRNELLTLLHPKKSDESTPEGGQSRWRPGRTREPGPPHKQTAIAESATRWSCGLCKAEWTVPQKSELSQCPLCRGTVIVCLSKPTIP
jgi:transposase-like protein